MRPAHSQSSGDAQLAAAAAAAVAAVASRALN